MGRLALIMALVGADVSVSQGQMADKCGFGQHLPRLLTGAPAQPAARPLMDTFYETTDGAFSIHYDTTGFRQPDLTSTRIAGVPDWVLDVGAAFSLARDTLLAWGYRPHPDDGDGRYDIFLLEYDGNVYGETFPEIPQGDGSWTSYIQMDNDFAGDENYFSHNLGGAQVTAAHEYFHAVQLAYKFRVEDLYLFEFSSTWFEERTFPEVNDWTFWMDSWSDNVSQRFSDSDGYSTTFFGHYLAEEYGPAVIRELWDSLLDVAGLTAVNRALAIYGGDLADDWSQSVVRLLLNGRYPEGYYHPDQALLPRPQLPDATDLSGSRALTLASLAPDKVVWFPVGLAGPSTLSLAVESGPGGYSAMIFIDQGGFSLEDLSAVPWVRGGLNQFSEIVIAAAGNPGDLIITAAATDSLVQLPFVLHTIGPNPYRASAAGAGILTLRYQVGATLPEALHRITIYNLLGQTRYREVFRQSVGVGSYRRLIPLPEASRWPAGIYLVSLEIAGKYTLTRPFTILR